MQLHDFFVETLGHTPLAFLELEFCGGGDLHDLILASERDDHVGGEIHGDRLLKPAIFGGGQARDKRGTGVPADQIARVILGLCEGLQCLHEVSMALFSAGAIFRPSFRAVGGRCD